MDGTKLLTNDEPLYIIWTSDDYVLWCSMASLAVWYKTKFGSQILATNFGVFFMIYVMF